MKYIRDEEQTLVIAKGQINKKIEITTDNQILSQLTIHLNKNTNENEEKVKENKINEKKVEEYQTVMNQNNFQWENSCKIQHLRIVSFQGA